MTKLAYLLLGVTAPCRNVTPIRDINK